ncbi:MAG: amidohydrolase family protein [Bryobacteraceae bacterium]|nr:amidohydrolase family protein [Bryobacteraceae bacterium]
MICRGIHAVTGEAIEVRGERAITSVEPLLGAPGPLPFLAPGFVDLQVNGFAGVDYCAPTSTVEEIGRSLDAQFATGVTRLLPTVITGSHDVMAGALRRLADARESLLNGETMEGFHVEGPHISPEDGPRGAHPLAAVRPPSIDEFRRLQDAARGGIKLITLSPEYDDAPRYIEAVVREGIVVSIGHTKASSEQIANAVSAGATMSTHIGNGAHSTLARHPNYIWDQLAEDRLTASFIVDGIHLGAAFLKSALRAKGLERSVLITDAVMPCGMPPGDYQLGEVAVTLHPPGDRVTLRGGTRLAGSALRMDRGVEFLMKLARLSLAEAVTLATTNPARAGRIAGRLRGLQPGEKADLVEFDYDAPTASIRVRRTWLAGRLVFEQAFERQSETA